MSKKNLAIVFSGTRDLVFAMANVVIGIKKHSPNLEFDTIVYHDGICKEDQDRFNKITSTSFKFYNGNKYLEKLPETENIKKYSIMSFAIYEIFNLLNIYKRVIYLDSDLLIQKDITEMLSYGPIAMGNGRLTINEACGFEILDENNNHSARSFGVVIVNDSLPRYEKLTTECYQLTKKYWDTLVFPDQGILNLVMALNKIKIENLPKKYNTGKAQSNLHKATIVHMQGGKSKFWNNGVSNIMFPEWNQNNEYWESLGGSPYIGPRYYWGLHGMSQTKLFNIIKSANALGVDVTK